MSPLPVLVQTIKLGVIPLSKGAVILRPRGLNAVLNRRNLTGHSFCHFCCVLNLYSALVNAACWSGEESVLLQLVKILNVVFGKTIGIFAQKPNLKVKVK